MITPGPWQTRFIYRMIQAAREQAASEDSGYVMSAPPENDWDDAELIASAPDMLIKIESLKEQNRELLEALKVAQLALSPSETIARFCDINKTWHDDQVDKPSRDEVMAIIQSAIAKATGKEQS